MQVALVTGSATGVGRACAMRFARLGFAVVVNYSKSEADAQETVRLVEACGVPALLCKATVADDAQVKEMVAFTGRQVRPARRAGEQRRDDALRRSHRS